MGDEINDGPINSFVNPVVTQIRVNPPRIIKIQAIKVMEVGRSFISFFLIVSNKHYVSGNWKSVT